MSLGLAVDMVQRYVHDPRHLCAPETTASSETESQDCTGTGSYPYRYRY